MFFLILFSCQEKTYTIRGDTQGTTYTIKYNSLNSTISKHNIDSLLKLVDLSMSTYIDNSIISLINRGEDIILDSLISTVIKRSIEICHQTNGMFDITISPLVKYWGFGPDNRKKRSFSDLNSLSQIIGCDKLSLKNNTLIKSDLVTIDLNGIAQGFSVDYLSNYLYSHNILNFMIEIGGEVRCSGTNFGKVWKIAIDKPTDKKREWDMILELNNMSLATSGSYRNYYYADSIKISHTINPKTLKPTHNKLISATILYSDCISADAYATACMAFGLKGAKKFLTKNNILGCLIYVEEEDTITYLSEGFSDFLHISPGSAPQ